MIRVKVSIKEALALFLCEKLREVKSMCQIIEDFKISLIESGKNYKTIKSYVGDIKLLKNPKK